MWGILEKHQVQKAISKAPREVVVRYEAWKRIVEMRGPEELEVYVFEVNPHNY